VTQRSEGLLAYARSVTGFMPDAEGSALYRAALVAARRLPQAPLLEIGTYCGKSAVYLGAAAVGAEGAAAVGAEPATPNAATVVFSVDHHRGSEETQAGWEHHDPALVDPASGRMDTLPRARLTLEQAGLENIVVLVVGPSATVAAHWSTPLAMLFIDGGHGAEVAWADYRGWAPKVAAGGLLAIHDVFPDPADGGRPPYELFCEAQASGQFDDCPDLAEGSLRVLQRRPADDPGPARDG
jgi:MMP 1-O-methyltransferase